MTAPINTESLGGAPARADGPIEPRSAENGAARDAFATLVQRALGRHDREPGPRHETRSAQKTPARGSETTAPTPPDSASPAQTATTSATPTAPAVAPPVTATTSPDAPAQDTTAPAGATAGAGVGAGSVVTPDVPAPATAPPRDGHPTGPHSGSQAAEATSVRTDGTTAAPQESAVPADPSGATALPSTPPAPASTQPNPSLPTVVQTGAPAPSAPTTSPTTAPARASVSAQVVPEITRLVSRGDGVHRVTLELNPRALGEVRVVLTVRQGEVHVRLAAGAEARAALTQGQSELTRALDRLGLSEHTIAVAATGDSQASGRAGEHSGAPTDQQDQQTEHQAGAFARHDTAGGSEQQRETQDHHSRTGADQIARDGVNHRTDTTRVSTSSSAHRSAPAGAVDLRM